MAYRVRYYRMPHVRKPGYVVVFGEWPIRVMKHRGWTRERCVHTRGATQSEAEWLSSCRRHQAIRYSNAEILLRDEADILDKTQLQSLTHALTRADVRGGM